VAQAVRAPEMNLQYCTSPKKKVLEKSKIKPNPKLKLTEKKE
jgi:hypothetical protein